MNAVDLNPGGKRRAGRRWPFFIVGLLVAHVSLMMTAVMLITHGPPDPVVPGYYQKGVDWDHSHAAPRPPVTGSSGALR